MKFKEWVKATYQALASQTPENRQGQFSQAEVDVVLRQSISVLAQSLQSGDDLRLNDIGRLWVETEGSPQGGQQPDRRGYKPLACGKESGPFPSVDQDSGPPQSIKRRD